MKPKYFTLVILLFSTTLFSQEKWGAFAGMNYSFFTDGFAGQLAGLSTGIQLGVNYEHDLNETVSFRPGAVISQQGDRQKDISFSSSPELKELDIDLLYLNFPMDFKFWDKIYLVTGPQIGFLAYDKANGRITKTTSGFDFGLNLGVGFKVNKFFSEFTAYQGLSNITSYQYYQTGSTVNVKNAYVRAIVGWHF